MNQIKEYRDITGRLWREVCLKDGTIAKIKVPSPREIGAVGRKYKIQRGISLYYVASEFATFNGTKRTPSEIEGMTPGDLQKITLALK